MNGFFFSSSLLDKTKPSLEAASLQHPKCAACGLQHGCPNPFTHPIGKGRRGILIIAGTPSEIEVKTRKPLADAEPLRSALELAGVDMRNDCWVVYAEACFNPLKKGGKPVQSYASTYCRPLLLKHIRELKPSVIITLGAKASSSVLMFLRNSAVKEIETFAGFCFPVQEFNAWLCPTFSPSDFTRKEIRDMPKTRVLEGMFENHIIEACNKQSRPWKELPCLEKFVDVILSPSEAVSRINRVIRKNEPTAFDYEANCLKPEYAGAKLVCCSMSRGKKDTFAYMLEGDAWKATRRFLVSRVPKVASNMKYEDRMSKFFFGVEVREWLLDTMLAAHYLDPRKGITSIKFLSFLYYGVSRYNRHIEPLLEASGDGHLNRIGEIAARDLLQYCGEDSLYEILVGRKQLQLLPSHIA